MSWSYCPFSAKSWFSWSSNALGPVHGACEVMACAGLSELSHQQGDAICPLIDSLVSRNLESEGWQAANPLSTVSPVSQEQMSCLGPGAAAGSPLPAPVVYQGRSEGRKRPRFSRKELVFLSRFSFGRLKK